MSPHKWTEQETIEFKELYPQKGKRFCMDYFGLKEHQIRSKAANLGLRQDKTSEFNSEWRKRQANARLGKPRGKYNISEEQQRNSLFSRLKIVLNKQMIKLQMETPEYKQMIANITKENGKKFAEKLKNGELNHPRGMLGKTHNLFTLQLISDASKRNYKKMTPEQKENRTIKSMETKIAKYGTLASTSNNGIKCSWKMGWREIGGKRKYYRSRWEYNYACYLEFLKQQNEIKEWSHEPDTFWFENIKRGCRSYLPDFKVRNNNDDIEYHEVKGWMTDRSKTALKRMAKYYPNVKLILIQEKQYKEIYKKLGKIIEGFELSDRDKRL